MSNRMAGCCGEPRETPYCPICGKRVSVHSVVSLLAYCRGNLKRAVRWQEKYSRSPHPKRVIAHLDTVEKWTAWVGELEELLRND